MSHRALRALAVTAVAAIALGGIDLVSASRADASTRVSYEGSIPGWAKEAKATGAAAASTVVQGEAFLSLRNQDYATYVAKAVSDPASSGYRNYWTPRHWIETFSPTTDTYNATVSMLRSRGLTVTGTPTSRQYVVFRGTVQAIQKAFSTSLRTYDVNGKDVIAPATAPSLSASVGKNISGIVLDQGRFSTKPASATQASAATPVQSLASLTSLLAPKAAPKAVTVSTPCSAYTGQRVVTVPSTYGTTRIGTANCGYTPRQLRAIYKTSVKSGTGQTVAIIDAYASPTIRTDVNAYSRLNGEAQMTTSQFTDISPDKSTFTDQAACGNPSGWQGEQTLDVEAVHAVAPRANILYVGASDCGAGTDLALSRILDQRLANIVSNSYGGVGEPSGSGSADYIQGEVNLQLQAAAEGIGLYFASGDDGDERLNTGTAQTDFPASSPWVTAVGGTAVGLTASSTTAYTVGWGDTLDPIVRNSKKQLQYTTPLPGRIFGGGAGGGRSRISGFTTPWYQQGAVSAKSAAGRRLVPDVAALADPFTGFLIGYHPITNDKTLTTGGFGLGVAGGTSLATPIVAALVAIMQQGTGSVVGFANPVMYSVAKSTPSAFTDVVPATNKIALAYSDSKTSYAITLDTDSGLTTGKGYDFVTGLGQLNIAAAAKFATPVAPTPTPTATPTPTPTPTPTATATPSDSPSP